MRTECALGNPARIGGRPAEGRLHRRAMRSDQPLSLTRYDRLQHSLNFAQRLYPACRSLTPKHWLCRVVPLLTLARGAKGVLEDPCAVLPRAPVVAFSNIGRYRPDRGVQLTGDFYRKRVSSKHFSICERWLQELLRELVNVHALERISHERRITSLQADPRIGSSHKPSNCARPRPPFAACPQCAQGFPMRTQYLLRNAKLYHTRGIRRLAAPPHGR